MSRPVQERPGRRAVPALPRNAAAPSGSGGRRRVTRPPQAARDRSSTKNHAPQQQSTKNQLCYVAKIRIAACGQNTCYWHFFDKKPLSRNESADVLLSENGIARSPRSPRHLLPLAGNPARPFPHPLHRRTGCRDGATKRRRYPPERQPVNPRAQTEIAGRRAGNNFNRRKSGASV